MNLAYVSANSFMLARANILGARTISRNICLSTDTCIGQPVCNALLSAPIN